ncbi:MAG: bacteriohemerythrin [Gammaproteobacteria bacterium]|nr:bacteriohemerythrin [Gammaproteobacteria bacterium]
MKLLNWDETLSVQIDEVDEDHRRLIDLFNILNRSVAEGDSPIYIEAVLEELLSCTAWHFRHEERLMLQHAYDGLEEHKAEHKELIESAGELKKKFLQEGTSLTIEDIDYLERWLTGHILGTDMAMGAFLCEVM